MFTKIFVQVHVSGSIVFHSLAVEFDGFKFGFASGLNNVFTCCVLLSVYDHAAALECQ